MSGGGGGGEGGRWLEWWSEIKVRCALRGSTYGMLLCVHIACKHLNDPFYLLYTWGCDRIVHTYNR